MSKLHQTRRRAGRNGSRVDVNLEDGNILCPKCDKPEVELECEICLRWFHPDCVNVSALKFDELKKHNFHWYCLECDVAAVEIHGKMKALQDDNAELKNKVNNLTKKITKLENNRTLLTECETTINTKFATERELMKEEIKREIKEELKPVLIEEVVTEAQERFPADNEEDDNRNPWRNVNNRRNTATPNLREIINEEMYEQQQIDRIKKNLVVAGIHETGSNEEDLQAAKEIISSELSIEAEIEKVERCGKRDADRPRLLKLFMKTQDNRKNILKNALKLRNSANEHIKTKVFISPDQTIKQQKESKNLRDALKATRTEHPGKTFKIKRGEIIEVIVQEQE